VEPKVRPSGLFQVDVRERGQRAQLVLKKFRPNPRNVKLDAILTNYGVSFLNEVKSTLKHFLLRHFPVSETVSFFLAHPLVSDTQDVRMLLYLINTEVLFEHTPTPHERGHGFNVNHQNTWLIHQLLSL
jgi:hypothetical protein